MLLKMKNLTFRGGGGGSRKNNIEGGLPKKMGLRQCQFKGGLGKKEGVVFLRGGLIP